MSSRLSLVQFQRDFLGALAAPQSRLLERIGLFVAGKTFYIESSQISFVEFVPRAITPLPGTDAAILGLGHCQGRTLLLVDVRKALTDQPGALDRHHRVIAMRHDLGLVCELVDLEGNTSAVDLLQEPRMAKLLQASEQVAVTN